MEELEYHNISETSINIKYNYGGEYFTFNLYNKAGVWILHPFEGILLGNREMSILVMGELFKNKAFQVMLAKERIPFSELRSSIDVEDVSRSNPPRNDRSGLDEPTDNLMDFIQQHTLDDIINIEQSHLQEKVTFYKDILQQMFMNDLGPSDPEFQKVQQIVRIYDEALSKMSELAGPDIDFGNRRRW